MRNSLLFENLCCLIDNVLFLSSHFQDFFHCFNFLKFVYGVFGVDVWRLILLRVVLISSSEGSCLQI
jgi:hypothetical protein